jgi:plastocyanin
MREMTAMRLTKTGGVTIAAALMTILTLTADSAAQAKVDLTGKWAFDVQTDAGTGTPTVTLKQDGEKLTGHYSSATLGEADLTGTVKGQNVTFTFDADLQGTAVRVTYVAKIESNSSMKGTIDIGGQATGTFTGKRQ